LDQVILVFSALLFRRLRTERIVTLDGTRECACYFSLPVPGSVNLSSFDDSPMLATSATEERSRNPRVPKSGNISKIWKVFSEFRSEIGAGCAFRDCQVREPHGKIRSGSEILKDKARMSKEIPNSKFKSTMCNFDPRFCILIFGF